MAYGWLFFGTIVKRRVKHIYVANWFYGAYIIAVALLHIVNNIAMPAGLLKSYSVYTGAVDAMVQWWYGHNAVAFFLTAGFLAMMYYFVPKQAQPPDLLLPLVDRPLLGADLGLHVGRPAPPALHRAAGLGAVGGHGVLGDPAGAQLGRRDERHAHASGVWHKLRTDPILKFLMVASASTCIATFEGPMMSIKTVNSLSHYTDWTVGHVHSGTLGWVAMISIGSLYALSPRLLGRPEMYSTKLIDMHFWLHTIGVVLYIVSMWIAGITEGLMWRATNADGTLTYGFVESLVATYPYYLVRVCWAAC